MEERTPNVKRQISPAFKVSSVAILTAITAVFTLVVRIPIAPTRGYINLGDVAIYFTAFTLGPITAMIAGALGTGLADIIGGYPQWSIISFFIHGIQGFAVGAVMRGAIGLTEQQTKLSRVRILIAGLLGTSIMVLLYYLAGAAMSGFGPALAEIPGNIIQNVVGVVGGLLLTRAIYRAYPPVRDFYW